MRSCGILRYVVLYRQWVLELIICRCMKMIKSILLDVYKRQDKEKPDIIIIGVPEPILPLNKKHLFSFGIRAYEIYQAVDVDYCILNLLSGEYSDQFETEMKNVCKYRYNVDIDDFFVSNFSIVSNSLYSSELKYVYVQMNALPKSKNFFNADDLKDERWFNKIEARLKMCIRDSLRTLRFFPR